MSVYKTKAFARLARKAGIADAQLMAAAAEVIEGRFDADLGGGVYKQRVARAGGGKSGGFRTILAFRAGQSCFFIYGFAKSVRANIAAKELEALRAYSALLLSYGEQELDEAVSSGELVEIGNDAKQIAKG
ncbi:MAG: hypothetical protein JWP86_2742 [Phenylobacterium sp.]|nr:hypothetical protein [Phenylobacterium sp.]